MKFEIKKSEIQTGKNTVENTVTMNQEDSDFIISILSTSLYSKPVESFIREAASNAWDSHIEAGNTEEPIVIELLGEAGSTCSCIVRDFGVGISPKRFEEIYTKIGSSTKRETNGLIGGYGIGRFAALSCSDMVQITSNYEGIKYTYVMLKEDRFHIDLVNKEDTEEANGVEIKVDFPSEELSSYMDAIKSQLSFFENIYVLNSVKGDGVLRGRIEAFNNRKIEYFNNMASIKGNIDYGVAVVYVLLGNVTYPLKPDLFQFSFFDIYSQKDMFLRFDIGDLEVTPNREELKYSPVNKAKIQSKIDKMEKELVELLKNSVKNNYDNLYTAYEDLKRSNEVETTEGSWFLKRADNKYSSILGSTFTYKGQRVPIDKFMEYMNFTIHLIFFGNNVWTVQKSQIKKTNESLFRLHDYKRIKEKKAHYLICDPKDLNVDAREYLKTEYKNFGIIKPLKKSDLKHHYRSILERFRDDLNPDFQRFQKLDQLGLKKEVVRDIISYIPTEDNFRNSTVPQDFIDRRKQKLKEARELRNKNKLKRGQTEEPVINLKKLRLSKRGDNTVSGDSDNYLLSRLNVSFNGLVIYDEKGSAKLKKVYIALRKSDRVTFVGVSKSNMKYLENNSQKFVYIEDFLKMKNSKILRDHATAFLLRNLLREEGISITDNYHDMGRVSHYLEGKLEEIIYFCKNYWTPRRSFLNDTMEDYIKRGELNPTIMSMFYSKPVKDAIKIHKIIKNIRDNFCVELSKEKASIIAEVMYHNGTYKPNDGLMKNGKILNLKKK